MCLIIAPGKDGTPALLPREVFDYVYKKNNDGFGAMWVEDGRVQHFKTLGLTDDEIYSQMEERVERNPDVIFHMRNKTHGKIIPGLSHPFRILNKKRHGKDLFFMHNGVLGSYGNNLSYGQSDTTVFKDKILIPLLTRDPDALDDPEVWNSLEKLTSGSRLIFMDNEGNVKYGNESTWNNRYGLMLSNEYMLPYESKHNGYRHDPQDMHVTSQFTYFRNIDRNGVVEGKWVACPKIGYVRTEAGLLYKDHGLNKKIYHAVDYIPKEEEYKHLTLTVIASNYNNDDDFVDDDLPFEMSTAVGPSEAPKPKKRDGPDPIDNRLRYARLLHNTAGGNVASREQLMADLLSMSEDELNSFVFEDEGTTSIIMSELIEMIFEYNDSLWALDPNNPKILNPDVICRIGQTDYHKDAMMEISKIRKKMYEEQIRRFNEIVDGSDEEAAA